MLTTAAQTPLWEPSRERRERATLTRFMRWAGERDGRVFADYEQLWRWSVDELEAFWAAVWEFFEVRASTPYERVLGSRRMPGAQWFPGSQLNYAEHVLAGRDPAAIAVRHCSELRVLEELSWGELREQVAEVAGGLRALGVGRGDRVVAYMPNIPETLVAFLATSSLGAIWSSAAPEFGVRSVVDRFAQIEPTVLLAVDGYRYGGRDFDRSEMVAGLLADLPTVGHAVVLSYLGEASEAGALRGGMGGHPPRGGIGGHAPRGGIGGHPPRGCMTWAALRERGAGHELGFEQVPFDHPLWVLYSSGTTGLPKAIVQGHGGILLEQLKHGHLHLDLHAGARMFWFTTTGWMMWNFLVGCLLTEASIVMYDGSPAEPDLGVLWRLAQDAGVTCFGTSAGYITSAMKAEIEPARDHDLSALESVGSTGSPLPPEGFVWIYEHVKRDLWLFSTSGGTDVCTAFACGCVLRPVYAGELQCRALGCAVEAWSEQGEPLLDEVGELVITAPMPSMPICFWNDAAPGSTNPVGERYRESYFEMFPGIWRHGDWIRITPRGGTVIHGRSDSTINRQGVRMGTSEIYRAAEAVDEVLESLVVDVPRAGGDSWMPLFVVLRENAALDRELEARIRRSIREYCSPRHVPDEILQVEELPRTLSNKLLELPVKRILMGTAPERAASIDSLANPRALDFFVELARRAGA